ncbi:hypothetical protein JCM11491_004121 [Sporobolomyces phaffii]
MTGKKQADLEQGEGSSLLPSPPPYTALPASTSSSTPSPALPAPPSRPLHSHPQGPSPFASLPLPQTSLYAHQRQMAQADRRARRRFCAALCWAGVIYLALGVVSGAIAGFAIGAGAGAGPGDDRDGGHRHGHGRDHDRGRDWIAAQAPNDTQSTTTYAII